MTHRIMRPYRRRRERRRSIIGPKENARSRAVIGSLLVILLLVFGLFLVTRRDQTSPFGDAMGAPVEHVREVRP